MKTKDKVLGTGVGLAALAAAGAYFLYGQRGAKNRETVAGWALQLKGEVLEKMESLKDVNQQAYNELVEETAERYGRVKQVSASELKHITDELKNAWTHIGWAFQLKGEVLEKMKGIKDINQQAYNELVEETAERYGRVKKVSATELTRITDDLKNAWTHIGKQLK